MSGGNRLSFPSFLTEKLRSSGYRCAVTGGGGWIGQAVLEMLEDALGERIAERVSVFGSHERSMQLRSGRKLLCRTLDHLGEIGSAPTLFVHCAFLTKDRLLDTNVESFVAGNRAIADRVAEAIERSDARGIFVPSSGAVYKSGTHVLEDDLAANPYGMMKLEDEGRFGRLSAQKRIPLCQPRIFNLSGPFINKPKLYALASMINMVLAGMPITISASHRVVRSYVHVRDLVSLAFAMLVEPEKANLTVFDTAGHSAVELGELAELVRDALMRPDLNIERPNVSGARDSIYVGDGCEMLRLMATYGLTLKSMNEQIQDTATYLSLLQVIH